MFRSKAVNVLAASATLLIDPRRPTSNAPQSFIVYNTSTTATMYVGGDDVSSITGVPIGPESYLTITLLTEDKVYARGSADLEARVGGTIDGSE